MTTKCKYSAESLELLTVPIVKSSGLPLSLPEAVLMGFGL